jgi:hypothetical protein
MDDNEYLGGRSPEQDEAADEVEVDRDAGVSKRPSVPPDRDLAEGGEPMADPGAERPRTPQAGL